MENAITTLSYENSQIRTVQRDGEIWWVLSDVCTVLGLKNPSKVASRLDEDERSNFELGRQGKANIINESGLYSVILRSDKPETKQFKRWITHEVLPSLRKTGSYSMNKPAKQEYKSETKFFNGVTVMTVADAAFVLGKEVSTIYPVIKRIGRETIDYEIISGDDLKQFKKANPSISKTASCIEVIYKSGYEKLCRFFGITIELPCIGTEELLKKSLTTINVNVQEEVRRASSLAYLLSRPAPKATLEVYRHALAASIDRLKEINYDIKTIKII